ncbi:hypothetical protein K435DRAFT_672253 [Dendrothele bispora CBS 962.96]|uniref:Uncharacterized protein n=1 Tax=Dendrothele bispora (strain CBS 962.96) TaxID=1314807 RepID=A0A4V4HEU8_DENBC|nr:hypothetical protein K435DRAFT_672253 [Dendrothele bispora CBS 962.96]
MHLFKVFKACGTGVAGSCAEGTKCSSGDPSFCLPLDSFTNSTEPIVEVTGYGRPIGVVPQVADADPIPVFLACTDAQFSGSCIQFSVGCDFCFALPDGFQNDISSIRMLNDQVGCNFWVASNCVGDGIDVDSGAIFDLSATNYNDRTVAGNCYLRS